MGFIFRKTTQRADKSLSHCSTVSFTQTKWISQIKRSIKKGKNTQNWFGQIKWGKKQPRYTSTNYIGSIMLSKYLSSKASGLSKIRGLKTSKHLCLSSFYLYATIELSSINIWVHNCIQISGCIAPHTPAFFKCQPRLPELLIKEKEGWILTP